MRAIYSCRGAMLFYEFISKMKNLLDFSKAMVCAHLIISTAYMIFGIYVYTCHGQCTIKSA